MRHQSIFNLGLLALSLVLGVAAKAPAQGHAEPAAKAETHGAAKAAEAPEATPLLHEEQPTEKEKINILKPDIPLSIVTVVIFLLLLGILGRYAWGPIIKALHERESHLEHVLLDSERARNEAEASAAEHRRQLNQAADEIRMLHENARKEAAAAAETIIKKAQEENEAAKVRAERDISGAKDQALAEIWTKTADLAVSVAGRVLSKEMGEADHRRLVELATAELPANGQGARA